jgi:ribonuclease G
MQNEILINAVAGETRVAILEKKQFVELHIERARSKSVVGSVVKGRVLRVLPGMQAAFVDIGLEKAAFLYVGDYVENIEDLDDDENGGGGRGRRRRNRNVPNIESLLSEGQEIVVEIAKEPIGSKGARITSHVSIAGRHLVLTPWAQRVGVSRKIDSDRERRRLREIVSRVKPADLGFIIRTAGEGTRDADLEADVRYLTTVWDDIQIKKDRVRAPAVLYEEPSLPLRVIRDFANAETRRIRADEGLRGRVRGGPEAAPRALPGRRAALRPVRPGGADRREPRAQGLAQVGRLPDRRPERGAHRDRREHRPLRRQA